MTRKDRIIDDIAHMTGGTVNVISGLNRNIKQDLKARIEEMATHLNLVPREDFERLEAMLVESRQTQEELLKRVETLEKRSKK